MKRTLRSLLLLAVTAVTASTAQAAPVTYNFSGTKISDWGNNSDMTVVGTVTLDVGATPDAFDPYWGEILGYWYNGAFAINAITDTGYMIGTADGGGSTEYRNWDYPYWSSGDDISWTYNDGIQYRYIRIESGRNADPNGDYYASVSDPWTPLTDDYRSLTIYDYDYRTGVYRHTQYSLDSFTAGPPPDTTPPTFTSLTPSLATLSPPNHQMVPITLAAVTSDNVGVVSTKIIAVTSSEPDNGLGDGDTAGDFQITGDLTVNLRAERSGKGNGRTYTITAEAADAAGNKTQKTTTVFVPKSQSKK